MKQSHGIPLATCHLWSKTHGILLIHRILKAECTQLQNQINNFTLLFKGAPTSQNIGHNQWKRTPHTVQANNEVLIHNPLELLL